MVKFNQYRSSGRTLYIKFKCHRCEREEYEELEACDKRTGAHGDSLSQMHLPNDWTEDTLGRVVLCGDCKNAYMDFLEMKTT